MKDWNEMTIDELLDAGVTPEKIGSYAAEYYATVKAKQKKVKEAREAAVKALDEYFKIKGIEVRSDLGYTDQILSRWLKML